MKRLYFIFLLFLLLMGTTPEEAPTALPTDYALFFAVNDYQSEKLSDLSNPISNAVSIATILKEEYGFQTEIVKNPTLAQIEKKLEAYEKGFQSGQLDRDGQLLVFFSGHGSVERDIGFFLAADTDPDRIRNTALDYPYWRNFLNSLPCRHVFVAIDACFSVRFDPSWNSKPDNRFQRVGELSPREQLLADHAKTKTRIFFTSDGKEEETPDRSNFAKKFKEGLLSGGGADAILTSTELYAYVEGARPRPHCSEFGDDKAQSSFLFVRKNQKPDPSLATAQQELQGWEEAKKQHTLYAYQRFQERFPKSDFVMLAEREIKKLEDARALQQDRAAWETAKRADSWEAYDTYLKNCSLCTYKEIAELKKEGKRPGTANATGESIQDLPWAPEMIFVKGGSFTMGSPEGEEGRGNDEKQHTQSLSDYYIGKYEVTVSDFARFVEDTQYKTDAEKGDGSYILKADGKYEKKAGINWRHDVTGNKRPQSEYNHPVIHVSWNDADAYCKWLSKKTGKSYQLPTEVQWEYAARSRGKAVLYSWGSDKPRGKAGGNVADETAKRKYGWSNIFSGYEDGYVTTAPVGSFLANDLGAFDMTGNVWEWCQDWYAAYSETAAKNYKGPQSGSRRVLRGGSWSSRPQSCRVAVRGSDGPDNRNRYYGFRVARISP